MDHRDFVSRLPAETRADLTQSSDRAGLLHLAGYMAAIGLSSFAVLTDWLLWPMFLIVQGILLVFLFTLLHETSHKTPFATGWINTVVGHICGFILFLPATWFRYFHFAHHRYTQIPGKDPELDSPKPETVWEYLIHLSGVPVWKGHMRTLICNAVGWFDYPYLPHHRSSEIIREARRYLALYAVLLAISLWLQTAVLIFLWLLPLLIGQPFLRLYLLAEHGHCPFVANMLENSRTTYTNRIVRVLAWNMPYHAEHHSYPTVPFHKLPKLNRLMKDHLIKTAPGYMRFHQRYVKDITKEVRQ
jgi:fatty acid desaturase